MVSEKITSQLIKEQNINHIYQIIRDEKAISRVEISKKMKLSQTSVGRAVSELLEAGYIREGENVGNSVGRQRTLLHIIPGKVLVIGVFLCSDRIDAGVVDISGQILLKRTYKIQDLSVDYMVEKVKVAIDYLLNQMSDENLSNLLGIGISVPGSVDYKTGYVMSAPIFRWREVKLGGMLRPCYLYNLVVDNDVKSFAKAQRFLNAPQDPNQFLVIHLGTGIAMAEMMCGRLMRGYNNVAGEVGHILIDPNGALCDCGRRGCLQTRINKTSIEKELGISYLEAVKRYYENDEKCFKVLNRVVNDISMWLANFINIFDPWEVFLTGSMVDEWEELVDLINKRWQRFLWDQIPNKIQLKKSSIGGEDGNIIAAASNIFYKFVIKDLRSYYDNLL